jgi:chorismate-pyruvate lyase
MFKAKTLRRLPPETRELARLLNELDSVTRRLRNRVPKYVRLEAESRALWKRKEVYPDAGSTSQL